LLSLHGSFQRAQQNHTPDAFYYDTRDVTTAYISRKIFEEAEDHHKTFTELLTGV
jgi:hypothetical protein